MSVEHRLLIIAPQISDVWYPEFLYYTDVLLDTISATNWVRCPQDITPIAAGYVGAIPVIFSLDGSIWHIDFTNNTDAPFKWTRRQKYHGGRARMGTQEVNNKLTTMGLTRMITYDGYEARDFDQRVRGFYDQCNIQKIINTYAHRMLTRNYLALAYTRVNRTSHDRVMFYNIDDKNFCDASIAAHSIFSVKGQWLPQGTPPGNFYYPIRDQDFQEYEFVGTQDGRILQINTGYQDEGVNIAGEITSAQLNPYQKDGYRCELHYIKFLISAANGEGLQVDVYKNDSSTPFKTVQIDSPGATKTWQLASMDGEVGDFFNVKLTFTYEPGVDASDDFIIHGILLGTKPSGKIRNRYEYTV